MEDFVFLSEEDKSAVAYHACLAAPTAAGAAYGSFVGGVLGAGVGSAPAALLGGLIGLAMGLAACPRLTEPVKKKLFSAHSPLSDRDLLTAMQAIQTLHPDVTKKDAMHLVALLRADAALHPTRYSGSGATGHA